MRRKEGENGQNRPVSAQIGFGQGRCVEGQGPAQPSPTAARLWQESWGKKAGVWDVFKLLFNDLDRGIEGTLVVRYLNFFTYLYIFSEPINVPWF